MIGRYNYATINGKNTYLSKDLEKAKKKLALLVESEIGANKVVENKSRGNKFLDSDRGIIFSTAIDDYLKYIKVSQSADTC